MVPWAVVFPIILLGLLSNGAHWVLFWNTALMIGLLRKPHVLAILFLVSPAICLPCVVLGYYTIGEFLIFLAPLTAAVWSACLLIYARLLGRVAWIAQDPGRRKTRRRRRSPE
jgi:hypothetical protein